MPEEKKPKVTMERPVCFRVPDVQLCDAMNAAIEATGASTNDLCLAAVRAGLVIAVAALLDQRRKAENVFLKKHSGPSGKK